MGLTLLEEVLEAERLDLANAHRLRYAVSGGASAQNRDLVRQTYRAACAAGFRAGVGTTLKPASAWSRWEAEQGAWDPTASDQRVWWS